MTRQRVTFCALGGACVRHACIREPSFQPSRETVVTTGLTLLQQTLLKRGRPLGEETSLRQLPIPVLALHRPGVPARVTGSRTGKPGARHPLQLRGGRAHFIADRGIGGVRHVAPPTWLVSNFLVKTGLILRCLTLCNPMDRSPPGSSVHGILQARILAAPCRQVSPRPCRAPGGFPATLATPGSSRVTGGD